MDTPQPRSGLVTAAEEGRFVDVARLAAGAGLMARVRLHPDVWALCEPKDEPDALLAALARDQLARQLLFTLKRHLLPIKRKPVTFRSHVGARLLLLSARWVESEGRGAIEVYLGDF